MNSTDPTPEDEDRNKRIDKLLLMIGGLEEAILNAMEQSDWDFVKVLKSKKLDYYERLRRVAYGLPETRNQKTED